jgi:hypothetical protein
MAGGYDMEDGGLAGEDRHVPCENDYSGEGENGHGLPVTVRENVGTGPLVAQALGTAVNPQVIRFS